MLNIGQLRADLAEIPFGHSVVPKNNQAVNNEVKALLRRTDAENRMRRAAVDGTDTTDAVGVIQEIYLDGDERAGRAHAQAEGEIKQREMTVSENTIDPLNADLILAETKAAAEQAVQERTHDCVLATEEAHRLDRECKAFRASHKVQRDPYAPDPIKTVCLLISGILFEVFAGIVFYKDVSNSMLDAAMTASLASLAVTGAGVGAGFAAIWALNGQGVTRMAAATAMAIAALLAWMISLWLAHDRDQLAAYVADEVFLRRIDPMLVFKPWEWLNFATIQGPMLLVITLGIAAFAAIKGYYGFVDPLPGYSRLWSLYRKAANHAASRQADLREAAQEPLDQAVEHLKWSKGEEADKVARALKAAEEAEYVELQYRQSVNLAHSICNTALRTAKDAWLTVRPELPTFFQSAFYTPADVPPLTTTANTVRQAAVSVRDQHRANDTTRTEIQTRIAQYRHQLAGENEARLASVRNLAAERFRKSTTDSFGG